MTEAPPDVTATVPTTRQYPMYGVFSPANLVTIARILASPYLFWLIVSRDDVGGTSWQLFVLAIIFGSSDYLDGWLARKTNSTGRLGAFLDPFADKVVVIGSLVSFWSIDRFHWLPVVLIAAREAVIMLVRVRFAAEGLAMPARQLAKWKATIQGLALLLAAAPALVDYDWVVQVMLWASVALTLWTGAQYILDGRAATRTTGKR